VSADKLGGILGLHKNLAVRYKEYETADGDVPPVVVLNEMRYALRATMKLLSQASFDHLKDKELEAFNVSLQETHHALRNAYHDLVDGILIQISVIMDDLLELYPVAAVNILGSKRLEILKDLNEVEKHVAASRGDGMKREQLYEVEIYDKWFSNILEHYQFVDQVAQVEILREHERLEEKRIFESRRFWITIVLSILGIVIAVSSS